MKHRRPAGILAGVLAAVLVLTGAGRAESVRETPVVRVVKKSSPSVVNISTEHVMLLRKNPVWGSYGAMLDELHRNQLERVSAMKLPSLGSGVIVSEDGLVITNAHVIGRGSKIFVTLSDGKTVEASALGTDNVNDLALLKIEAGRALVPMPFARDVILGEPAVTIGNPLGLQNSVSAGIISGTGRRFSTPDGTREIADLVQTDAAISPGSSGGALVNFDGELVGINIAVVQNAPNIGFAVPVAKVRAMLEEYRKVLAARSEPSRT